MTVVGAVFLLTASIGISMWLISESSHRIEALEAVCGLTAFIKQNIEAFGTPIDGILDSCRIDFLEKCSFGESMRKHGIASAASEGLLPLSGAAELDFKVFSENIGSGYRDEEIKRCEYYLSRFEAYLSDERERFERCRPMYRYLPPLGALSVIIMCL